MTLGRLLRWILIVIFSFIIGGLFALFQIHNPMIGFFAGMVWLIIIYRFMGYKIFSPKKFEILIKKIQEFDSTHSNN